ncbi:MAG: hypothetical protein OXL37_11140 [Chloroflexota bacterium]|nr:hypothetical protein [Chloroflexota bacterium]MDE2959512.1 hypothetical protein [Chloroflexota bacterium]
MNLIAHYDPEIDAISLHYSQPTCGGYEVAENWSIILHVPEKESRCAAGLEVIGVSAWLPLGKRGYCKETDTLTFGGNVETATVIAENGDLIAYWSPDQYDPDYLLPIAVDLRNASKHLAPVLEAQSQLSNVASG